MMTMTRAGFEPTNVAVKGRCLNRLANGPKFLKADDETRTRYSGLEDHRFTN